MRQTRNEKMSSNPVVRGSRQPVRACGRGWRSSAAKETCSSPVVVRGRRQPVRARRRGWRSSAAKETCSSPVARPRELDVGSLCWPPERSLSSGSVANVRLGVCFSTQKLSQCLEPAYPLKQNGRMLLNA
jgi:hypothetical protein